MCSGLLAACVVTHERCNRNRGPHCNSTARGLKSYHRRCLLKLAPMIPPPFPTLAECTTHNLLSAHVNPPLLLVDLPMNFAPPSPSLLPPLGLQYSVATRTLHRSSNVCHHCWNCSPATVTSHTPPLPQPCIHLSWLRHYLVTLLCFLITLHRPWLKTLLHHLHLSPPLPKKPTLLVAHPIALTYNHPSTSPPLAENPTSTKKKCKGKNKK